MAQTAQINIRVDGQQAENSVSQLNQSIQQTEQSTTSLRTQLRQITQELAGLEPGSARFNELSQRAGQLRDTIQDTNAVINATAGNVTENLAKGLGTMAQTGIMGFQGIMGAMALFGVESENLQKTMVALQGAMALTQALEFFGGFGDKLTEIKASLRGLGETMGYVTTQEQLNTVATQTNTVAQTTNTTATNSASVATRGLGAAMSAIPILLLVAGIGLLIANWDKLFKSQQKNVDISKEYKSVLQSTKQPLTDAYEKVFKVGTAFDLARKGVISKEKALNMYNTELGDTFGKTNDLVAAEAIYIKKKDAFVKATMERAIAIGLQGEAAKIAAEMALAPLEDQAGFGDKFGAAMKGIANNFVETFTLGSVSLNDDISEDLDNAHKNNLKRIQEEGQKKIDALTTESKKHFEIALKTEEDNNLVMDSDEKVVKSRKSGNKDSYDDEKRRLEELEQKRQEMRKLELDYFEKKRERQEKYEDENQKLITESGMKRIEEDGNVFISINELEKDFILKRQELKDEEEEMIKVANERQLENLKQSYIEGTFTIEEYETKRQDIITKGYENLLPIEQEYLSRRQDLQTKYEETQLQKDLQLREQAIKDAELLEIQTQMSKREMDKQRQIFEVQMSRKTEEEKQEEIRKIKKEFLDGDKYMIEQEGQQRIDILTKKYQEELDLLKNNLEEQRKLTAKYNKDVQDINSETQGKVQNATVETTKVDKQEYQVKLDNLNEFIGVYSSSVTTLLSNLNSLTQQQTEQRIGQVTQESDIAMAEIQRQYDAREISEEQFNAFKIQQENKLNEETKKLKREQFRREKAFNLTNAIMSGAMSVLQALASSPPPANFILAALSAVATGVQIATISQQQFSAARGGIVPGNGLPGDVDSVPSMLAPGEAVINARSTAMFGNTLSMINQVGGGIPLTPTEVMGQGSSGSGTIFSENQPQSIRAYVVETEITDTQRRVGRIERSVEF